MVFGIYERADGIVYVDVGADDCFLQYLKEVEYRFNRQGRGQEKFVSRLLSQVLLS